MSKLILDFSKLKKLQGDPHILLMPPIPPPMHQRNPRSIKGEEWWTEVRHKAYNRNEGCCWACAIHGERLEAHELYKIDYVKCSMQMEYASALCHDCHMFIHEGFMNVLLSQKKVTRKEFNRIRDHGLKILSRAKLLNAYHYDREGYSNIERDWKKWHLIVDGKKYYSKWNSPEEWSEHFGNVLDKRIL